VDSGCNHFSQVREFSLKLVVEPPVNVPVTDCDRYIARKLSFGTYTTLLHDCTFTCRRNIGTLFLQCRFEKKAKLNAQVSVRTFDWIKLRRKNVLSDFRARSSITYSALFVENLCRFFMRPSSCSETRKHSCSLCLDPLICDRT